MTLRRDVYLSGTNNIRLLENHESKSIHQEEKRGLQDCEAQGQALRHLQEESQVQNAPGLMF